MCGVLHIRRLSVLRHSHGWMVDQNGQLAATRYPAPSASAALLNATRCPGATWRTFNPRTPVGDSLGKPPLPPGTGKHGARCSTLDKKGGYIDRVLSVLKGSQKIFGKRQSSLGMMAV